MLRAVQLGLLGTLGLRINAQFNSNRAESGMSRDVVGLAEHRDDAEQQVLEATCANPRCDDQFRRAEYMLRLSSSQFEPQRISRPIQNNSAFRKDFADASVAD